MIATMDGVLLAELRKLYSAERQIAEALPRFVEAASTEELRESLLSHGEESREHITRLEESFGAFGEDGDGAICVGMQGLLEEGLNALQRYDSGMLRDAALIAAALRVEHYELASYGAAIELARGLGHEEALALLVQTWAEEDLAEKKLGQIAIQVNAEAYVGRDDV